MSYILSPAISSLYTRSKKQVVHIELDSNATVNYIKLSAAKSLKCKISPNSQLSTLADGVTKLPAVGEIHVIFYRNDWQVEFKAVVVKNLQCILSALKKPGRRFLHTQISWRKTFCPKTMTNGKFLTTGHKHVRRTFHLPALYGVMRTNGPLCGTTKCCSQKGQSS